MRTQWATKGNRNAGSSCSRNRGLHRYLRNFGGCLNTPNHPPRYATAYFMCRSRSCIVTIGSILHIESTVQSSICASRWQ